MEGKILEELLKDFSFITVDFGMGEIITDPSSHELFSIEENIE